MPKYDYIVNVDDIVEDIMNAQAELQVGIGLLRLSFVEDSRPKAYYQAVENYLAKSLAMSHKLLDDLGHPMYQPATHPDVND